MPVFPPTSEFAPSAGATSSTSGPSEEGRGLAAGDSAGIPEERRPTNRKPDDFPGSNGRSVESEVLELIATGVPLANALLEVARMVEFRLPGMHCSILLQDASVGLLRLAAAPTLPLEFRTALDARDPLGNAGLAGAAFRSRECVSTTDVASDPRCADFRQVTEKSGLAAWWSLPIVSMQDKTLGVLSLHGRVRRSPEAAEVEGMRFASHLAGIAIQRHAAEAALRLAEEKYRNIFENALDGIFQISPEGRLLAANPAFAQLFGYASAADLSARVRDVALQLCLQPERYAEFAQALQGRGVVQRWELPMRGPGGSVRWVSLDARLAQPAGGGNLCYEGIARDVTERKRLEQQFLQAQKMEAFGQLAGGVAHDFNNLLTVIIGNLSLIRLGDMPAENRDAAIDDCIRSAQRAAGLTQQLLTFSRRQPVEPQDLDLNQVVADMTKMLQPIIGEQIVLETTLEPGGAHVRADRGMIEQILMNLALNSRDAMPRGGHLRFSTCGVDLDALAAVATARGRPGSFVRLSVQDDGSGIAPEHLSRIFEPFFSTKEVGKGTGLGLATVFGIVEQHEGWIDVDSRLGEGTTMHVFLPRIVNGSRPSFTTSEVAGAPRGGSETILLAEDEENVRTLMVRLLELHGYRVLVAANGVEALALWRQQSSQVDLLVTDVVMPGGIDGHQLAELVQAERGDLPVVFCSGYSDERSGRETHSRSRGSFLAKPFDVHVLLDRVRTCLDSA